MFNRSRYHVPRFRRTISSGFHHSPAECLHFGLSVCVFLTIAAISIPAVAQSQVGCIPNTANYPCVYVANQGQTGTLSVINGSTNAVIGIPIVLPSTFPTSVAVTPDNASAYVAFSPPPTAGSGGVAIVTTGTNTVLQVNGQTYRIPLTGVPSQIAITPDGTRAWVAEPSCFGCVPLIDIIDTTLSPPALAGPAITGLLAPSATAFSPDGLTAYVADQCANAAAPGQFIACVDKIDVATHALTAQIPITGTFSSQIASGNASIAITPDGAIVCISVTNADQTFGVAFVKTSDDSFTTASTGAPESNSTYGFGIIPAGTLYSANQVASDVTSNQVSLFNPTLGTFIGTLTVGTGPTGVGVSADGLSIYVTNSTGNAGTVSIINTQTGAVVATPTVGLNPQGVAAMPSLPPAITTQPASQVIDYGQTATLTVVATGTAPFTYQWYQGVSGDQSAPGLGSDRQHFHHACCYGCH